MSQAVLLSLEASVLGVRSHHRGVGLDVFGVSPGARVGGLVPSVPVTEVLGHHSADIKWFPGTLVGSRWRTRFVLLSGSGLTVAPFLLTLPPSYLLHDMTG